MANKGRHLEHTKARRINPGIGTPRNNEGSDGDLALRVVKGGLRLFAKYGGKWYTVGESSLREPSGDQIGDSRKPGGNRGSVGKVARNDEKVSFREIKIPSTSKIIFDKGGYEHTYIKETSNDVLDIYVGGINVIKCDQDNRVVRFPGMNGIYSGYHGSGNQIKILPSDFTTDKTKGLAFDVASGGIKLGDATGTMYATVQIPDGFKATAATIYGSDTGINYTVSRSDINSGAASVIGASTAIGTECSFGSSLDASTTNFLFFTIPLDHTTDIVYGGEVTIAHIT